MKVFIYRLSYTLLALSLVFFVYAVNKDLTLNCLASKLEYPYVSQWLKNNITKEEIDKSFNTKYSDLFEY